MAAVQVKHAENKQLQNKIQQQKKKQKKNEKSQEFRRENVAKFSESSLRGIIFNIYCTIIGDDSGCLMVQQSIKKLLLHVQVSSRSHCGIDLNHSGSIRDTVIIKTVCVTEGECVSVCVCVH